MSRYPAVAFRVCFLFSVGACKVLLERSQELFYSILQAKKRVKGVTEIFNVGSLIKI